MKRKAFTVIELLVVLAIIAILAAIIWPIFASRRVTISGSVSHVQEQGIKVTH